MPWLFIVIAGLLEVVWAVGLKYSEGFTQPLPSVITVGAFAGSLWLLALATRTIPIGTAYALFVGIGAVGATLSGTVLFREPLPLMRGVFLALLVVSLLGLKATGEHA